jgi:hypothetical protein
MYTVHEDQYIYLIISRLILLGMGNVLEKSCGENQNTHFVLSGFFKLLCHF